MRDGQHISKVKYNFGVPSASKRHERASRLINICVPWRRIAKLGTLTFVLSLSTIQKMFLVSKALISTVGVPTALVMHRNIEVHVGEHLSIPTFS